MTATLDLGLYGEERAARLRRLWQRYEAFCRAAGRTPRDDPGTAIGRQTILRREHHQLGAGLDAIVDDALEAGDLAIEDWEPRRGSRPTAARSGSRAKVEVLAQRAARGETLWHEEDGPEDD